jgi:hypothetical protein
VTEFLLGAALGFGAAWLIWEDRWFWYSIRKGIPYSDM